MLMIFVRHGETQANMNLTIQGHRSERLTELGRRQARELGLKLLEYGRFDQLISSDLERAKETAEIISDVIHPCKILHEKRLRERCYGRLEGKHIFSLKRLLVKNRKDIRGLRIPDAEGHEDFELRIKDFYRSLVAGSPEQRTLLVTHAGVMQVILEEILGRTSWEIDNCEGFRISDTVNNCMEVCRF